MTMQFISGLFFLKWALLLQLQEAVPTFESSLLSRQQVGKAAFIKEVGENIGLWESSFFLLPQGMEKRLEYHSLNFMNRKY